MTKKNKRGIITVERPNNDLSECTIKSNDLNLNSLHVVLFLVSLIAMGPIATCIGLIAMGFFNSYTKTLLCAILATGAYSLFGFIGLLLFKVSCIFTLFTLFSNEGTFKKIKELKDNNEFNVIDNDITDIEEFGLGAGETYTSFKDDVIMYLTQLKLEIKDKYPKVNMIIDGSYDSSIVAYDNMTHGFNILKDDSYLVHKVLYNSKYDIYVKVSDYVYLAHMLFKFASALFTASNIFSQIPGMDMNNMDNAINGDMKMPETEEEAQQMLSDISNTLSSLSSLSSMMGGMGGMQNMLGIPGMPGMPNPGNTKNKKQNINSQNQEDIFAKLLEM